MAKDAFANARPAPAAAPEPSRMTLASVTRGKVIKPPRVLLYGAEGVGKTSWAAGAPDPIFLCAEDGTNQLDVARFPLATRWKDVLDALRTLINDQHEFQTLVVDTVNWLEPLCWGEVCRKHDKKTIEDFGFQKGQKVYAPKEWQNFLNGLDALHSKRNMGIILLGHSLVRTFRNPEGDDYDTYELALDSKVSDLTRQWADAVLFARFNVHAYKRDGERKAKAVGDGERIMHTTKQPAFSAKNRYGLPEQMPLDYATFIEYVNNPPPRETAEETDHG